MRKEKPSVEEEVSLKIRTLLTLMKEIEFTIKNWKDISEITLVR